MPTIPDARIEVIAPNLKRRLSGVTATVVRLIPVQARMIGNLALDAALGVVPVAGDLADVWFKAHLRNLRLLQKELGEPYIDLDGPPSGHRR